MTIAETHTFLDFINSKEQSAYFSHEEYDMCLHRGQMIYFSAKYDEYGLTQKVHDGLAFFKKPYDFTTGTSTNGIVTTPTDYLYFRGAYTIVTDPVLNQPVNRKLQILNEDEIVDALNSQLRPVSLNRPIALIVGKGQLQLYPQQAQTGRVFYFEVPPKPFFKYTLGGTDNRVVTQDVANSVDLLWNETDVTKVIFASLPFMGINMDEEKFMQYFEMKKDAP